MLTDGDDTGEKIIHLRAAVYASNMNLSLPNMNKRRPRSGPSFISGY